MRKTITWKLKMEKWRSMSNYNITIIVIVIIIKFLWVHMVKTLKMLVCISNIDCLQVGCRGYAVRGLMRGLVTVPHGASRSL